MMQLQRLHAFFARTPRAGRGCDRPTDRLISHEESHVRTCTHAYFRRDLFLAKRKIMLHTLGEIASRNEAL